MFSPKGFPFYAQAIEWECNKIAAAQGLAPFCLRLMLAQ
jgi:hypothetical protein